MLYPASYLYGWVTAARMDADAQQGEPAVVVDPLEFIRREGEVVECSETVLDLRPATRPDESGRHTWVAKDP